MRNRIWLLVAILGVVTSGKSEVIVFANGDRLTGTWVRMVDGKLLFKSETVGEASIPVAKVQSFSPSGAAVVLLKGGQSLSGHISLREGGQWEVRTDQGAKILTAESVNAVYPQELFVPRGPGSSRKPWKNWRGRGTLGASLLRGDRQAGSLSLGVEGTRRQPDLPGLTEHSRTNFSLSLLLASTREFSGVSTRAATVASKLQQDFLFTPRNFVFVFGQLEHIDTQSLGLRQTYGTGLGRDLIRKPRVELSFLGGVTLVRERFQTGERRKDAEGVLGESVGWKLSDRVSVTHGLNFFPSLSQAGEFRFETSSTLLTRISSRLSLTIGFADRYLSRPLPAHEKNEVQLTTGLGFELGR
jgi:putative salt-induced outer membrane protein YdiY